MMRERHQEADRVFQKLFEPGVIRAEVCNVVAWRLATDTDLPLRPRELAVEFARKAVELAPEDGDVWKTLGVVQLRAGHWKESIDALQKSNTLRKGGDSSNWFFLAMAQWHLGDKDEARKCYNQGVQWMEKNQPEDEELPRFRAEAAELMSVEKKKD
jgi:predicted Zn-dependent protease